MTNTDRDRTRAILLTTQRTGSTFLIECLGSHPDIESVGELLIGSPEKRGPIKTRRFRTLAKTLQFARSGAWMPRHRMESFFTGGVAKVRLFKAMYNHISNPLTLGYLRRHTEIRILHLRRNNLLKVYVSKLLMTEGKRVRSSGPVAVSKVHVDPVAALAAVRKTRDQYEHFETVFGAHRRLQLVYENLIEAQTLNPLVSSAICDFLEIERVPMRSRLMKVNPDCLADFVVNYDELASYFSGTEFVDLLD
jgi:LPS sulfotransferase NodH